MIDFSYKIVRSRRRTTCICVADDGVVVRCPLYEPLAKIEEFVNEKSGWIKSKLVSGNKNRQRLSAVIEGKSVLVKGMELPVLLGESDGIFDDCVKIKNFSHIKKVFIDNLCEQFTAVYNRISSESGLKAESFNFKNFKSKWGCCYGGRTISFNFKLLMLPVDIWKYVIAHELCHTRYMNHSYSFYSLLGYVMPDYAACKKRLKEYSPVCSLY